MACLSVSDSGLSLQEAAKTALDCKPSKKSPLRRLGAGEPSQCGASRRRGHLKLRHPSEDAAKTGAKAMDKPADGQWEPPIVLPQNHPARIALNDELHARPPEPLLPPCSVSFLALFVNAAEKAEAWEHLCELAQRYKVPPPAEGANHFSAAFGPFRLKWERHSEYVRYKFIVEGSFTFSEPAIGKVPKDWLEGLPGQTLVARNVLFTSGEPAAPDFDKISEQYFAGNTFAGGMVAGGNARAYTDFRIHSDGFGRLLVENLSLTPRQAGRTIQRMLEIDAYRMLALLALPLAQKLAPFLAECEQELVEITSSMVNAGIAGEPALLERLMKLEAAIESQDSKSHFRFSAAAAYYELVQRRIGELRERRIEGLQLFEEFMERRLAPAMNTCTSAAATLKGLSARVAGVTQLLSTKVNMALEQQNQGVLTSMNRRAELQLRLQQTVEGLSVAAITYYIAGLVGYAAKAVKAEGVHLEPDLVIGASIPFIAAIVAYGLHRVHASISKH